MDGRLKGKRCRRGKGKGKTGDIGGKGYEVNGREKETPILEKKRCVIQTGSVQVVPTETFEARERKEQRTGADSRAGTRHPTPEKVTPCTSATKPIPFWALAS